MNARDAVRSWTSSRSRREGLSTLLSSALFTVLCAGCGAGAGASESTDETDRPTTGGESSRESAAEDDGMQIEGILGTISQRAIEDGIQRSVPRVSRCFADRYDELAVLGGQLEMSFRVKTDGTVRWVYLRRSTVGDRATERCILNHLSRIEFARPRGGEAEFTTPLTLDPPDDVRPPVAWAASRVASVASSQGAGLLSSCAVVGERLQVTAYVGPGGQVLAAGAAIDNPEIVQPLDCVAEGVRSWTMPDPGSYPAKVTFELN